MKIDANTMVCAVIGNPVRHTLSPAIHNAAFEATRMNAVYVAFEVTDVKAAIDGMRGLGIRGFSITIPHKIAAMEFADELDPIASYIGSINTLVNDNGKLIGYNTDGIGALRAIDSAGIKLTGAEVTILGSGGAARAIACTLAARAELTKLNILGVLEDEVKTLARHVANQTSAKVVGTPYSVENLRHALENCQLLIHCTPVGMHPKVDETLVPADLLFSPLMVFDVVYNPMETRLIKDARQRRCRVISGVEMFIYQAVEQFELFTRKAAPEAAMRKVVLENLKKT